MQEYNGKNRAKFQNSEWISIASRKKKIEISAKSTNQIWVLTPFFQIIERIETR